MEGSATRQAAMTSEERNWGMLCHLLALSGFLTMGLGFIVGPLVIWLLKKDQYAFVIDQGKESLNFQITVLTCSIACMVLYVIGIGFLLTIGLVVANLVLIIIASIHASKGERYRYPFAIRLIK
jgi:uncharacterized protein